MIEGTSCIDNAVSLALSTVTGNGGSLGDHWPSRYDLNASEEG